jgi:hypothetical protein
MSSMVWLRGGIPRRTPPGSSVHGSARLSSLVAARGFRQGRLGERCEGVGFLISISPLTVCGPRVSSGETWRELVEVREVQFGFSFRLLAPLFAAHGFRQGVMAGARGNQGGSCQGFRTGTQASPKPDFWESENRVGEKCWAEMRSSRGGWGRGGGSLVFHFAFSPHCLRPAGFVRGDLAGALGSQGGSCQGVRTGTQASPKPDFSESENRELGGFGRK